MKVWDTFYSAIPFKYFTLFCPPLLTVVPSEPTTPRPTSQMCPTDAEWYYNYPYCYYVSGAFGFGGNDIKNWKDANNWCNSKGGYLTSVHSTSEHNYLMSIVSSILCEYLRTLIS